jgi:hypothetical protein
MTGSLAAGSVPEDSELLDDTDVASAPGIHLGISVLVSTSFSGRVWLKSSSRDSPILDKWDTNIVLKCVQFWDDDDSRGISCSPLIVEELQLQAIVMGL